MSKMKDGQYYYTKHRSSWCVWQNKDDGNGCRSGTLIRDFPTKEDARREVYRLNGWFQSST